MARKLNQAGKKTREGMRQEMALTFKQAMARIGKTPQARCRWVLGFAALNLDGLSPKRWATLICEIAAFTSMTNWESHYHFGCSKQSVRDAQTLFQGWLEGLKSRQGIILLPQEQFAFQMVNGELGIQLRAQEAYEGSFYRTLREAQPWFRSCSHCATIFVAERRQRFCSPKCRQTIQIRRFHEKLGEKGFRDKRAEYYFNKLKKDNPGMKLKPKRYKPRTKPPLEGD